MVMMIVLDLSEGDQSKWALPYTTDTGVRCSMRIVVSVLIIWYAIFLGLLKLYRS